MAPRRPDAQHVWIYCAGKGEAAEIEACCRACTRLELIPEVIEVPLEPRWRSALKLLFPRLPAPYGAHDWEDFWKDTDAFVTASGANKHLMRLRKEAITGRVYERYGEELDDGMTLRRPSLLVTDRWRLCELAAMTPLRTAVMKAAELRDQDLVPVVRASDFEVLCGLKVEGELLPLTSPLSFSASQLARFAGKGAISSSMDLKLGVFVQHPRSDEGQNGDSSAALFGARCLALFDDGQCAYSAISPDGMRGVRTFGPWSLVNGHVVIGDASGAACVQHLKLSGHGTKDRLLKAVSYMEPVHIPVEHLQKDFDSPKGLAEVLPQGGDSLKLALLDGGEGPAAATEEQNRFSLVAPQDSLYLDDTMDDTWGGTDQPTSILHATTVTHALQTTAVHALLQLAAFEIVEDSIEDSRALEGGDSIGQSSCKSDQSNPRLLGLQRGMTVTAWGAQDEEEDDLADCDENLGVTFNPPSFTDAVNRLTPYIASSQEVSAASSVTTCPLRPGMFRYSHGKPSDYAYKSLEIKLCPAGGCFYSESTRGGSLKSALQVDAIWSVEDGKLVLKSAIPSKPAFVLKMMNGTRSIQQRVQRIELPSGVLVEMCQYEAFKQQHDPFPSHSPAPASQLVFGLVDPASPVLHGIGTRLDNIPYHAFEHELRHHGLPVDEILSDFRFLDRNSDLQVSVMDMRSLESYGSVQASPEVVHSLREALTEGFGSIAAAYEALAVVSAENAANEDADAKKSKGKKAKDEPVRTREEGKVTLSDFELFVQRKAGEDTGEVVETKAPKKGKAIQAKKEQSKAPVLTNILLKEWYEKTTQEDRANVFASLNPDGAENIDVNDFMSLHLHSAILALTRMEHFKGWIHGKFGRTPAVFEQVFKALSAESKKKEVERRPFIEGCHKLGYPVQPGNTGSIFTLLDRNFDGKLNCKDFTKLADFNIEEILKMLECVKRISDESNGGVDEYFRKIAEREKKIRKDSNPGIPSSVSFEAVSKVLGNQLTKQMPDADLKMLFLFLAEASGRDVNGYLTLDQFALLKGCGARAVTGCPARLRRILEEEYGSLDAAFQKMHTSWLKRALAKGLTQTTLAGLLSVLGSGASGSRPPSSSARRSPAGSRPPSSTAILRPPKMPATAPGLPGIQEKRGAQESRPSSAKRRPSGHSPKATTGMRLPSPAPAPASARGAQLSPDVGRLLTPRPGSRMQRLPTHRAQCLTPDTERLFAPRYGASPRVLSAISWDVPELRLVK